MGGGAGPAGAVGDHHDRGRRAGGGDGERLAGGVTGITTAGERCRDSAAAGLDRLRVVETGFGPSAASGEQWDDAGNLLVLAPGLVVSHERNVTTHARLERIGIDVITVPGSELSGSRGGPRSLCCPVSRDPAPLPAELSTEL